MKKQVVVGVRACRTASAVWTQTDQIFTWGTSSGQLGYVDLGQARPMTASVQPVQVTAFPDSEHGVRDLALTESLLVRLLTNSDIHILKAGRLYRVLPLAPAAHVPRNLPLRDAVLALSANDASFVYRTERGNVHLVMLDQAATSATPAASTSIVKPALLWQTRDDGSACVDIALGPSNTAILCTRSGACWIRKRPTVVRPDTKSATFVPSHSRKAFQYTRVPHLHCVRNVYMTDHGAFAAVRSLPACESFKFQSAGLAADLLLLQPHMHGSTFSIEELDVICAAKSHQRAFYRECLGKLFSHYCNVVEACTSAHVASEIPYTSPVKQSDAFVVVGSLRFPVHSFLFKARNCLSHFARNPVSKELELVLSSSCKNIKACALAALLLIQCIYTDSVCPVWDEAMLEDPLRRIQFQSYDPPLIRIQLCKYAEMLQLSGLFVAIQSFQYRPPIHTLSRDLLLLLPQQSVSDEDLGMCIQLLDTTIYVQSALMAARSVFFESLLASSDWTIRTQDEAERIVVDLQHLPWKYFTYVLRHLYGQTDKDIFDNLGNCQ